MSADAYGDLDRAHENLRGAADLVLQRWQAFVTDHGGPESIPVLAADTGIDLAGVDEAVRLLDQELVVRAATRPA